MKISLSFCLLIDILDAPPCGTPYILFKLEEIKKMRPFLCENMPSWLFRRIWLSPLSFFDQNLLVYFKVSNIGGAKGAKKTQRKPRSDFAMTLRPLRLCGEKFLSA